MSSLIRILVVAAALSVAAPASAATPFLLDGGDKAEDPFVAVDEKGIGHFVWTIHKDFTAGQSDVTVYCQVPRNGKACSLRRDFTIPGDGNRIDFQGPKVVLPGDGRVLVTTSRCCRGGPNGLFLFDSADNGKTFAAPREIGTGDLAGDAIVGPGEFSISTISGRSGGSFFQAAPIDNGFASESANVGDRGEGINNPSNDAELALIDSLTPIAAMSDLDDVFWRKGPSSGAYNSLGSWGPLVKFAPGSTPRLAHGPRGVFLLYQTASPDRRLRAVRWDGSQFSGTKRDVSGEGSAYEPDFFQDPKGTLHAAWRENNKGELRHRISKDGTSWEPTEVLVRDENNRFFGTHLSAAVDGGGFVVWDENGSKVRAVGFGTTKAVGEGGEDEDPNCVPSLTTKTAKVLATEGCFKKNGDVYTTTGDVRVNGIDIVTPGNQAGGSSAGVAATATITVDKSDGKIEAKGSVETKVGTVTLDKGGFQWDVPKAAGQEFVKFTGLDKFKVDLLGFPVTGEGKLSFDKAGKATIDAHLKMPKLLGGVAADVKLRSEQGKGLVLKGFKIQLDGAKMFGLTLKKLVVEYIGDEPPVFKGDVQFLLPPAYNEAPVVRGYFAFENGDFMNAGFTAGLPTPITLLAAPVPVFLTDIGFRLDVKPDVIAAGGVKLAAGAAVDGKAPVGIDALPRPEHPDYGFSIKFSKPIVLQVKGGVSLLGIPIAEGFVKYRVPDLFSFGGSLNYTLPADLASIRGSASGFLDLSDGRFNAESAGQVCVPAGGLCISGEGVFSSKGFAGCASASIELVSGALGFGITWDELRKLNIGLDNVFADFEVGGGASCDLGPWKEAPPAGAGARAAQSGSTDFTLPPGLNRAKIGLLGTTDAPEVVITAPDGRTMQTTANPNTGAADDRSYLYRIRRARRTELILRNPPAGKWKVATKPGSSSIAKLLRSDKLPDAKVTAKVTGSGQKRKLVYTVNNVPGQRVTISERAGTAANQIVANQTKGGSKAFTPAYGAKGKRELVATIESYGKPRDIRVVGSYTAPGPPKLSKPGRVIASRRGTSVKLRWLPAAEAVSYLVRIKLRDGTNRLFPTKKRALTIGSVAPTDVGSITVAGVDRAGVTGPAQKVGVKPKPRRRRR